MKAKHILHITVIDPDTQNRIDVQILTEEEGGMIGIDSSYLHTGDEVLSPYGNGELQIED